MEGATARADARLAPPAHPPPAGGAGGGGRPANGAAAAAPPGEQHPMPSLNLEEIEEAVLQAAARVLQRANLQADIHRNGAALGGPQVALLEDCALATTHGRMLLLKARLGHDHARHGVASALLVTLERRVAEAQTDKVLIALLKMATGRRPVVSGAQFGRLLSQADGGHRAAAAATAAAADADAHDAAAAASAAATAVADAAQADLAAGRQAVLEQQQQQQQQQQQRRQQEARQEAAADAAEMDDHDAAAADMMLLDGPVGADAESAGLLLEDMSALMALLQSPGPAADLAADPVEVTLAAAAAAPKRPFTFTPSPAQAPARSRPRVVAEAEVEEEGEVANDEDDVARIGRVLTYEDEAHDDDDAAAADAYRAVARVREDAATTACAAARAAERAAQLALADARDAGDVEGVEDATTDARVARAAAQKAAKARVRAELYVLFLAMLPDPAAAAVGARAATRRGDPTLTVLGPMLAAARAANPAGDAFPGSPISGELTAGSYLDLLAMLCSYGGLTREGNLCDAGSGRGMMLLAAAALVGCATCGFEIDQLRVRICVGCIAAGWTKLAAFCGPGGLPAATAFMVSLADLAACATLGGGRAGATHVFAFTTGMPEYVLRQIAAAANRTLSMQFMVAFQDMVPLGLRAEELPALSTTVTMHGSGERKTARFFRMLPAPRRSSSSSSVGRGAQHGDGGSFTLDGAGRIVQPITGDHLEQAGWTLRATSSS